MELKYANTPLNEGGVAISDCGTIHIDEIRPTLEDLAEDLELDIDLNDYLFGSAGVREYSGDLDIVLDPAFWHGTLEDLESRLLALYGEENVRLRGKMLHLRYPIVNYDPSKDKRLPRNGFVQIDFLIGDVTWEKFFHYTCPASEYKSTHRNIAITSIASIIGAVKSDEKDHLDRPVEHIRWKWSPKGFFRIIRRSVKSKNGLKYNKIQADEIIDGPYYNGNQIAKLVFGNSSAAEKDLESLESVISAVYKYCTKEVQIEIWQKMAKNLSEWRDGKDFVYPPEIAAYFPPNDK